MTPQQVIERPFARIAHAIELASNSLTRDVSPAVEEAATRRVYRSRPERVTRKAEGPPRIDARAPADRNNRNNRRYCGNP